MSDEKLPELIHAELLKRLKKTVNSKRSRMSVSLHSAEFVGQWQSLEIKGHAYLTGWEDTWAFDFVFRNNQAYDLLKACKLQIPERPRKDECQ